MNKNEKVKLSDLKVGDAGEMPNTFKFVVEDRVAEDRTSGTTTVRFWDGIHTRIYVWDEDDPTVTYLGKGRFDVKLIID
jgi:hypothetical protein